MTKNANLDTIAEDYAGHSAAIEATGNYFSIYDTLDEHLDVVLVNPWKTRVIAEAKVKTDRIDAKMLAHLLRADLVAESYVPPEDVRERRALVRGRKQLVEKRTDFQNSVHSLLDQQGIIYDGDLFTNAGREFLAREELAVDQVSRMLLETNLAMVDALTEQIEELEALIEERAAALEETQLLMSIPGVSYYSSLLIHAEIGEIDRFDQDKQLVSYAGLNPSIRESVVRCSECASATEEG